MTVVVLTAPDEGPPAPDLPESVWHETRHLLIMPDDTAYEISDSSTGVALTSDGITGMNDPDWDLFSSDSPILHGARFHGYRAPEREVVLPLFIYHDESSAAWTARYREFKRWLSPRHVVRWRVEHPESGEGRTLHMRYVGSGNAETALDSRLEGWKLAMLHFVADERPFWEGDPISRSWRQAEPVDFFDEEGSPPFHVSSSALLGDATVANPSDEPVWPVWTADDGDFDSVTVGVDGRVVEAPIEVRQPRPVDVAVNGDGSTIDGRSVVGENLARNPRGRNNSRQTLVSNLVTNPRGRTTDGTVTLAQNLAINPTLATTAGLAASGSLELNGPGRWDFLSTSAAGVGLGGMTTFTVGETFTVLVRARGGRSMTFRMRVGGNQTFDYGLTTEWDWYQVTAESSSTSAYQTGLLFIAESGHGEGDWVEIDRVLVSPGPYDGPYVDGDIWDGDPDFTPEWDGDPHASPSRLVAPAPASWGGNGLYWSEARDAVHVPAGVVAAPPVEALDQTSTLAAYDVEAGEVAYHAVTDPVTLPAADHDRYVRVMVTPGAYDGPYVDGDSTPEPETVVEWDDAPHASASRITALVPDGWGQGVRYGEVEDAVYIPAGVVARPATEPADGGTLVVRDLTAGTITRQPITGQARLPASDRGRYVRVMATTAPLFRGPYLDAHTWDEDPDLALEWAGEPGESGFQLTAPCPEGWDGEGVYYSATREAVFVPAGVEVAVQADGVGELVITSAQGNYRAPFQGVIPASTSDRYLSFAVMQPTGDPQVLTLDSRPGPRGKSAYLNGQRRTPDLTRREWAPIPPGEAVPVTLEMVGDGRVTCTITPLYSEAY